MTGAQASRDVIAFAERTLTLLDEGRFTATYKFAVLLALIEVCQEHATEVGRAPDSVSTRDLAGKVVEIYWPQTADYPRVSRVLRQNSGGQAEMVSRIVRFRERTVGDRSAPLSYARDADTAAWERLVGFIEWKLIEMPLPRLQLIGDVEEGFIYRIGWDRRITRAGTQQPAFDGRLTFIGEAGDHLVRLAGLLRPLIQRQWTMTVARFNRDLDDALLDEFLFGATRIPLGPIRSDLRDLQDDRCFYCGSRLVARANVDHFIPWARHPDNGLDNLVVADAACNGNKKALLASAEHVDAWSKRFRPGALADGLGAIAAARNWERHPQRTLAVARSIYLRLPPEAKLWQGPGRIVPIDRQRVVGALG